MKRQFYMNIMIILVFMSMTGCQHWKISNKEAKQVPHYPESTIVSSDRYNNSTQTILEAGGTNNEILDYYTKTMNTVGWRVLSQRDNFLAFARNSEGVMIDIEEAGQNKKKIIICYLAETNDFRANL